MRTHKKTVVYEKRCEQCNVEFTTLDEDRRFCSLDCSSINQRKFDVSRDKLEKLVWKIPTSRVAELFGVSDKAIEKRCKKLGIEKPPRGYWTGKTYDLAGVEELV